MSCISQLSILVVCLLLSPQYCKTAAEGGPFSSTKKADEFMKNFQSGISSSGVFSNTELNMVDAIAGSLTHSVSSLARSGELTRSNQNVMNMALASSLAEIAVLEPGGAPLQAKTQAIAEALSQSSLQMKDAEKMMSDIMMLATIKKEAEMRSRVKSQLQKYFSVK